jgi:hypothetical protein
VPEGKFAASEAKSSLMHDLPLGAKFVTRTLDKDKEFHTILVRSAQLHAPSTALPF